jgi:predicted RNase H-like HicB family nuclease
MRCTYPVVLVKERGEFWAYIPDVPGVYGRGRTRRAAKQDIRAALQLYIEDCQAAGDPVPRSVAEVVEVDKLSVAVGA